MSGESFLDGRVTLYAGDCLDVLTRLEECSVDACVTDPPYHLTSIVKRFGADNAAPARLGKDGRFGRLSGGFMNRKWDAPDVPAIEPGFAFWMAGFIDGEGCFSVHKKIVNNCETYDCQFSMTLRDDDKDIIVEIQRQLGGIGSIAHRPAARDGSNGKPQVRYCISSQKDCWRLREVLTVFPLRAKKARDFEIWSQALDAWITHEPGSSWEDVAYFRDALMAVRRYGADFHPSQLWAYRWARQIFRVLKPGAHLVAFGGTRTYHRMACAIEDAGFEIRDQLAWVYGSGFPKSHDVSKGIDATLIIGKSSYSAMADVEDSKGLNLGKADSSFLAYGSENSRQGKLRHGARRVKGKNITAAALEWQGWGTALKPSWEPIVLARKPLSEPTIAANVLRWGTGGLNIDGCRVEGETVSNHARGAAAAISKGIYGNSVAQETYQTNGQKLGRWPANLVHDGSEEVLAGFPETETGFRPIQSHAEANDEGRTIYGAGLGKQGAKPFNDSGSAARYFYTAKADADDRLGSKHPTVKPVDLMQWLVRLVTPPQGVILDPFSGTGTTAEAAFREGFSAVLIEREAEYCADIRRRMALCLSGPGERSRESIKARHGEKPQDHGPLFAEAAE